jgi:hypothetical protein
MDIRKSPAWIYAYKLKQSNAKHTRAHTIWAVFLSKTLCGIQNL